MNVIYIDPEELVHVTESEDATVYIGDLRKRTQYPETSRVEHFVSFPFMTKALSPLLLLGEAREICLKTSFHAAPITISSATILSDIEERIDAFFHLDNMTAHDTCMYRTILGDNVYISQHACDDHSCM